MPRCNPLTRVRYGALLLLVMAGVLNADIGPSGLDARPANPTCLAPDRPTGGAVVATEDAFSTNPLFSIIPTKLLQPPGDASRWFVLRKAGRIEVYQVADPTHPTVYLDIVAKTYYDDEGGLLGMAFHPDFPHTPEIFISYTARTADPSKTMVSTISRIILDNTVAPVAPVEQVLLTVDQRNLIHKGGDLAFGPDGYLYIGFGDDGEYTPAQDTTNLLGAMLRINVVGVAWPQPGYAIPATNPFSGNARCGPAANPQDCPEIYAWGFRNPWRWSFDRQTGALWLADVGQASWEEVDVVERGGNYGWPCREGRHDYNPAACPVTVNLIDPVSEYSHDGAGASITGGYVYRGAAIPALRGRYVFGDYVTGTLWALLDDGQGGYTNEQIVDTPFNIVAFASGEDGELYFLDQTQEAVQRLKAVGPVVPDTIPTNLADTGCVNSANPTQPASGLIPYAVNAPFWSDGAVKQRWLALPNGSTITINGTTNDWDLPPGSIIMKLFQLGGNPIETRLFMRHPDGVWAGYTYEWNAAGTQATRVIGGKTKTIGAQQWIYPSESQCMQCHTAAAGFSLGPETDQLNRSFTYAQTGRTANQLATLDHIGMFSAPLAGTPANYAKLPDPADTSTPLYYRARAYLHTNCSGCHRPGGPTPSSMDLRFTTALASTNACGVAPRSGNLGIANAKLLTPGSAASSIIIARMNRRDAQQMPPLASTVVDSQGVATVSAWINSFQSCTDADNDGVDDAVDNCLGVANANQRDTDGDGYGNMCDGDLDNNGTVNINDSNRLKASLNIIPLADVDADLDGNGIVNINDFDKMKSLLNKPPGPSALHP